jgi:hypothetical protein
MGINQSDVAMRDLLSQIDNLDAKKKRLRIAQSCQYGREMAEYYEVFDTMKRDMLKQSLIVAKIKEQQCEAHLQIMREYRRAEEQLQSTQPPPVNQHTEWATVATQAIRTIGELGKTLLASRATKQIENQRAATATEQRADEGRKETDEKPARRNAAEQTTTTVAAVPGAAAAVPAATLSTSLARTAPVGAMDAIEALCAKMDRLFGGAGGQPSTSMPVVAQTERATDTQSATSAATASITPSATPRVVPNVTPTVTASVTRTITPTVTASITPTVTPNLEQSERRADGCAEGSSLSMADGRPSTKATPAMEMPHAAVAPMAARTEAIVTPSVTPSVTSSVSQIERGADGCDEDPLGAKASVSPESTASPTVKQTAEPLTETAQTGASKGASLTLSQNPYVKSWRSIKSFVRRMTDMDLMVFTSSIPMFRSFLAMLRALTPYYQGPSLSLDELTEMAAAPS